MDEGDVIAIAVLANAQGITATRQIMPLVPDHLLTSGDRATIDRMTRAFLDMHELDVAAMEAAERG